MAQQISADGLAQTTIVPNMYHIEVSKKWGYPQIINFNWLSILNHQAKEETRKARYVYHLCSWQVVRVHHGLVLFGVSASLRHCGLQLQRFECTRYIYIYSNDIVIQFSWWIPDFLWLDLYNVASWLVSRFASVPKKHSNYSGPQQCLVRVDSLLCQEILGDNCFFVKTNV